MCFIKIYMPHKKKKKRLEVDLVLKKGERVSGVILVNEDLFQPSSNVFGGVETPAKVEHSPHFNIHSFINTLISHFIYFHSILYQIK